MHSIRTGKSCLVGPLYGAGKLFVSTVSVINTTMIIVSGAFETPRTVDIGVGDAQGLVENCTATRRYRQHSTGKSNRRWDGDISSVWCTDGAVFGRSCDQNCDSRTSDPNLDSDRTWPPALKHKPYTRHHTPVPESESLMDPDAGDPRNRTIRCSDSPQDYYSGVVDDHFLRRMKRRQKKPSQTF
ncbi:porin [Anopheles sinensis]|uniref:Porin n=1 Tax=Anopheles sinensis TaxID=74873 RepID=A0A084W6S5_ANOSI|nr:porin [Anopheles sinensis]